MIRLILFDIDGTLIRTGGAGVKAFERTFALQFGIENGTRGVSFAGRTDTSLVRQIFRLHGIPPTEANVEKFFDCYVFLLKYHLEQTGGAPCHGVTDFVRDLEGLTAPPLIGLLTGNIRLGAEIKLRHYSLWDSFEMGSFADDHEDRNQLAVIAKNRGEEILERKLDGSEVLVIGDTPADVECARAIKAKVLAVGTGIHSCEELKACTPTWVVENLLEVKAATLCQGVC